MRQVRAILYATVVAAVATCTGPNWSLAQVLSDYEADDLETLEWLREIGQIDEDEYERWEERFIDSISTIPEPDSNLQCDEPVISSTKERSDPMVRLKHGLHHRVDESGPYRQTYKLAFGRGRDLSGEVNLESLDQGRLTCRNRLLIARAGRSMVKVGDVDPNYCGGLVAGSHPIFLKSKSSDQSFLYPSKSRFNGVQLETGFSKTRFSAFASFDKDTVYSATAFGAQAVREFGGCYRAGTSVVAGQIRNDDSGGSKKTATAGLDLGVSSRRVSGAIQLAIDNHRKSALLFEVRGNRNSPHISVWHYSNGFFNPFGAGTANSDTREVYVPEIDLTYRSRQADETGVLVENQFGLTSRDRTNLAANWWKTGDVEKLRLKANSTIKLSETEEVSLLLMTGDDDLANEGHQIHSVHCTLSGDIAWLGRFSRSSLSGHIRSANDGQTTRTARSIEFRFRNRPEKFDLDLRLRWFDPDQSKRDDHYLYLSLKESVNASELLRLSVLGSTKMGPHQKFSENSILRVETAITI